MHNFGYTIRLLGKPTLLLEVIPKLKDGLMDNYRDKWSQLGLQQRDRFIHEENEDIKQHALRDPVNDINKF